MIDIINLLGALISIGLGAVGWLAPRYVAETLDLATTKTTMGLSELRAASGALFMGLGIGALVLGTPAAYAMVGFAWGGAVTGRITSIILDGNTTKKLVFFVIEVAVAAPLILLNI